MKTESFSRSLVGGAIIIGQRIANAAMRNRRGGRKSTIASRNNAAKCNFYYTHAKEIDALAQRYLTEKMNAIERKVVLERIQSLSPDQSLVFFQSLTNIQLEGKDITKINGETQTMIELGEAIDKYSISEKVNRLNLTREQVHEAIALHYGFDEFDLATLNEPPDLKIDTQNTNQGSDVAIARSALCIFPYVSCNTTTYTATASGASCGMNCINGTSYDRFSNATCELGACDHRIFYPSASRKNAVDGETSAADCVIMYYPSIISRWENGYTQLGYGVAGPASCGILLNVSEYLRDNTQVF